MGLALIKGIGATEALASCNTWYTVSCTGGVLRESARERLKSSLETVIRQGFMGTTLQAVKEGGNSQRREGCSTDTVGTDKAGSSANREREVTRDQDHERCRSVGTVGQRLHDSAMQQTYYPTC